jgi:hypothetical protein
VGERWSSIRNNRYVLVTEFLVKAVGGIGLVCVGAGFLVGTLFTHSDVRASILTGLTCLTIGGWLFKSLNSFANADKPEPKSSDPAEDFETLRQLRESWRHHG